MRKREYTLTSRKVEKGFRAAIVADLHDRSYDRILPLLNEIKPDMILVPGDLSEALHRYAPDDMKQGLSFLREATQIAPTFYALGNHEIGARHKDLLRHGDAHPQGDRLHPYWREAIRLSGATLLDESFVTWRGITIGGLGSGLLQKGRKPDLTWLKEFESQKGYKLLLCHHPEYYDRYLRQMDIDLVVSGHAHGGQWRFFGRGVYAPDQHLFPKYTSGVHENRLVISRGVANTIAPIPRLFNPCEVVVVRVEGGGR